MNYKKVVLVFGIISLGLTSLAQTEGVSIAPTVTPPDPSAMLDVQSTSKGILIPRVSLTGNVDVTTVPNPVKSLMVFNEGTAIPEGYYYWDGAKWLPLGVTQTHEPWKVIGTIGTMANGEPIPQYADGSPPPGLPYYYMPLSIRRRSDGVVEIKGMVTGMGSFLFSLPTGYIPPYTVYGADYEVVTWGVGSGAYRGSNAVDFMNISFDTN